MSADEDSRWYCARARRVPASASVVLGLLLFAFFYPIHTAEVIPYDSWYARMWFPSWV